MKSNKKDSRRQFLKNTSLGVLSLGIIPSIASSTPPKKSCDQTTLDYFGEGPFYTANPPIIQNNQLADINKIGERLIISGRVYNLDCTEVIPNTEIDIWHADNNGAYDQSGYNLRGKTFSNSQGFYMFETIKPGLYLNGSTYRPSHIHFKITAQNYPTLITQLYFEGDPYIQNDPAASINSGQYDASSRIIPITINDDCKWECNWDIVIDADGIVGAIADEVDIVGLLPEEFMSSSRWPMDIPAGAQAQDSRSFSVHVATRVFMVSPTL